jgi:hypothetical protein
MKAKFTTIFLEEANWFLNNLDEKPRDKIFIRFGNQHK